MGRQEVMQATVDQWMGLRNSLFDEQAEAVFDPSPMRCWQCSRRAGKTTAAMTEFVLDGLRHVEREYAYIALTRASAKNIAWPILRQMKREHVPDMRLREALLRVELPTGSALTLYGADRPDWMDRLFGLKLGKVWIDEAPFYSIDLNYLYDEILEPCVTDYEGSVTMMSRPGFVEKGLFWRACMGKEPEWKLSKWTWEHNPHMRRQTQALLDRRSKANPEYINLPSTRRNWFNEWVSELGKRVYRFEWEKNGIESLPWDTERPPELHHVLGIDLGWFDATAFVVGCWSPKYAEWYELESYTEREMRLDKVASRIRMYMDLYPGLLIVGDPDKRSAFDELRKRYQLPMRSADKSDKRYWIEQYNNDLQASKIKILKPQQSAHVEEMIDLVWEQRPGSGKQVEAPHLGNDACDAALYAFRLAYHHRHVGEEQKPKRGTKKYYDRIAEEMEREAEAEYDKGLGYA